ncbi:alpha/beta fold hydrolase [Pedobacter duraquae]|nr:alpha/beta hydrolase [Pedobacter duraquae]
MRLLLFILLCGVGTASSQNKSLYPDTLYNLDFEKVLTGKIDGKPISEVGLKNDWDPELKPSIPYGNNALASGRVSVKDASIYYELYGKGAPLLLLHGNNQSIKAFKKQIKVFSEKYKVIAVDTRGQGKSTDTSTGALSYDLFAEDMKTLLDSLHIPKVNILGWSDGGNTGLIMAYKYPSYVHRLATMGANTEPTEQALPRHILDEVAKQLDQLKKSSDPKAKTTVRLYTMILQEPHVTTDDLHHIQAPVLVMAGEQDMILEKHTRYIAKEITNGKLLIFKGATHYAPVEIPDDFNSAVIRFLSMKDAEVEDMMDFTPGKFN